MIPWLCAWAECFRPTRCAATVGCEPLPEILVPYRPFGLRQNVQCLPLSLRQARRQIDRVAHGSSSKDPVAERPCSIGGDGKGNQAAGAKRRSIATHGSCGCRTATAAVRRRCDSTARAAGWAIILFRFRECDSGSALNEVVRPSEPSDVPTGSFIRGGEQAPNRSRPSWAFRRRRCFGRRPVPTVAWGNAPGPHCHPVFLAEGHIHPGDRA